MRWSNKVKGDKAELEFKEYVESLGLSHQKTSLDDDRKHHIDLIVRDQNGGMYTIDVKSAKRVDGRICYDLCWIEIGSEYNTPWISSPLLSHVAFQQEKGWLVVPRVAIIDVINKHYAQATETTSCMKTLLSDPKKYAYRRSHMKREKCLLVSTDLLKPFAIDLKPETQPKITSFFKSSPIAAVNRDILIGPTAV